MSFINRPDPLLVARRIIAALVLLGLCAGMGLSPAGSARVMAQSVLPTAEPPAVQSGEQTAPAAADTPGAITREVSLPATQDAYISSAFPNTNFGGSVNLNLGWQSGGQEAMRILLQFDLSSIPANAVINSARYELFQSQVIPVGDGNMDFRAQFMRQAWNEGNVNWNNANFLGGQSLSLGSVPGSIGWQSGGARESVQAWLSATQPNFGVIITGDETPSRGRWRVLRSRETDSAPRLVVNFTANCDNVPPTATVQALPRFSAADFRVFWSGQDFAPSGCAPSGIANYDVEYRINGGNWNNWKQRTQSTDNAFTRLAPNGVFVEFRARATDNAGNVGQFTSAQASTTVDSEPPTSTITPLPEVQTFTSFIVNWTGSDNLSGIASYDVEFAVNDGPWQPLISQTLATSYQVTGAQAPQTYGFRVRATDQVGNVQTWPLAAQAETLVLDFPVVVQEPITPTIIKPTSPVTDSISLAWSGAAPAIAPITQFRVFYTYQNQPRTFWQAFGPAETSAVFPYLALGLGDGPYTFDITAVNSLGQETDLNNPLARLGRSSVIVDLADQVQPRSFAPYVSSN